MYVLFLSWKFPFVIIVQEEYHFLTIEHLLESFPLAFLNERDRE